MTPKTILSIIYFVGIVIETFVPLYFTRVPKEEQMMLDTFGTEYQAYMGRVGGIFPRLGR